jgi:DNA-binding NarL/FixJ family response regulator
MTERFEAVLRTAGETNIVVVERLNVSDLGRLTPSLLICDIDNVTGDPIELLRQIRFVLPNCIIAVFTGIVTYARSRVCHLAGANCLLAKGSSETQLALGLRDALVSGCYTDPSFAA